MIKTYSSSTLGFGCYPHKDSCDISSKYLLSHRLQASSSKNEGVVLIYIDKIKSRHDVVLPKTCGYKHCGEQVF